MKTFVISILVFILLLHPSAAYADGTGVGLELIPGDSGSSSVGSTRNLWFAIDQGNSMTRKFYVVGSPTSDVQITFEIREMGFVDGKPFVSETVSPMNAWTKFRQQYDTNNVVKAGKRKKYEMTVTPPDDTPDFAYESYLVVKTKILSTGNVPRISSAEVPVLAGFAQPMFVGVGNPKKYRVKIALVDVVGVRYDGKRFLRFYAENNSLVPIQPSASIQLKSNDFEIPALGPFQYVLSTIRPKTEYTFDIQVDNEIAPGSWTIFSQLTQGKFIITRTFSKEITFKKLNQLDTKEKRDTLDLSDLNAVLLPIIGIIMLMLLVARSQASNRKLKRQLQEFRNHLPDDSV